MKKLINTIENEFVIGFNEIQKKLEECKISVEEHIPKPEIAWEIKNHLADEFNIAGTNGNFSLIKGKAKSKKTFFIGLTIAATTNNQTVQNTLRAPFKAEKTNVLYFDTEQSKYHVQTALKRICEENNLKKLDSLKTYALRKHTPPERLKLIEHAIYNTPNLGFVVIDGIRDLITSINDESESSAMASKLLKWSEELNIHIVVVLHENPTGDKARGHIGTELTNKAETVLTVTADKDILEMSEVTPGSCRNKPFEAFAFEINESGMPVIIQGYTSKKIKTPKFDLLALNPSEKFRIITEAFSNGESFNHGELVIQLRLATDNLNKGSSGRSDNKIIKLITEGKNNGWLVQTQNRAPYTLGNLFSPNS